MIAIMTRVAAVSTLLVVGLFCDARAQEDLTINDKDIKVVHFEELNYPTFARAAQIEGVVVVRVSLDERGNVVKAVAISGKEPLIRDCLVNAKKWKFQPNAQRIALIVYNFTMPIVGCGAVTSFFTLRGANFATITGCPPPVEPER